MATATGPTPRGRSEGVGKPGSPPGPCMSRTRPLHVRQSSLVQLGPAGGHGHAAACVLPATGHMASTAVALGSMEQRLPPPLPRLGAGVPKGSMCWAAGGSPLGLLHPAHALLKTQMGPAAHREPEPGSASVPRSPISAPCPPHGGLQAAPVWESGNSQVTGVPRGAAVAPLHATCVFPTEGPKTSLVLCGALGEGHCIRGPWWFTHVAGRSAVHHVQ